MADCRDCRKFGEKLFSKGERCLSGKCTLVKRPNTPGTAPSKSGQAQRRPKKSEYGLQLNEKQKAKAEYGLRERQFANIFKLAAKSKEATGENMLRLLEMRLDNVVYRLGLAKSRAQARQLVTHGHFKVNGKILDFPSYLMKEKDTVEPVDAKILTDKKDEKINVPGWLKLDKKTLKGEVASLPTRDQIDTPVDEQLIVEYYSR